MSEINWNVTKEEAQLISKIVKRARTVNDHLDSRDTNMDITAAHLNGCKLDLHKLHGFDDFNLMHDVIGISNCIDRSNGQLRNCFLPRCASKA